MPSRASDKFAKDLAACNRRLKHLPELLRREEEKKARIEANIASLIAEFTELPAKIKQIKDDLVIFNADQEAIVKAKEAQIRMQEEAKLELEKRRIELLENIERVKAEKLKAEADKKAKKEAADALDLRIKTVLSMPESSREEKNKKKLELNKFLKSGLITDADVKRDIFKRLII